MLTASMPNVAEIEQLNSVEYLYLRELLEPRDNSLKLIVEEAVDNRGGTGRSALLELPELAALRKDAWPIESVEGCRVFELYWQRYAAYLVTEELVGSNAEKGYSDERYTGKILRVYTQSHFLDHVARDTGGHFEPLRHYKLICLNHLIDVVAYAPPEIQVHAAGSEAKPRFQ